MSKQITVSPKAKKKSAGSAKSDVTKSGNRLVSGSLAKNKIVKPMEDFKEGDFFGGDEVMKPIGRFATANQMAAVMPNFDDARLRRLGLENNPKTKAPWVPKPVKSQYEFLPTVAGVIALLEHLCADRDGLRERYVSMADFTAMTPFPKEMVEYAIRHGCRCRDDHGRISLTPFLTFCGPLFVKLFSGGGKHIEGMEAFDELDLNAERARLTSAQANDQERENALAEQRIHDLDDCEQRVRVDLLAPLRDGLAGLVKKFNRFKAAHPGIALEILSVDLPKFMELLEKGMPTTAQWVADRVFLDTTDYQI